MVGGRGGGMEMGGGVVDGNQQVMERMWVDLRPADDGMRWSRSLGTNEP